MKQLFITLLLIGSLQSYSQIISKLHHHTAPVALAVEFYYYGVDMALCTYVDSRKIYEGEKLKNIYGNDFSKFYGERIPYKSLTRWLNKDRVYYNPTEVQQLWRDLPNDWVKASPEPITEEIIHERVKSYELTATEGLAFVVIPYIFDKSAEKTFVYFVFFDLATRDLLWATSVQAPAGGAGFANHWMAGAANATRIFIYKDYKKILKTVK